MIFKCTSFQRKASIFFLTLALVASCKDPFAPEISFRNTNFLVVEGYINVGTDAVTTIRLSRTVPVDQELAAPLREAGASILIEDDQENTYPLTEKSNGFYASAELSLPLDRKYRIKISTNDQGQFTSEFSTPIETPAIDSVSWARVPNGIDISVATHDPQKKTFYYQWDYEEVWELRSPYFSFYRYADGQFIPREEPEIQAMRKCWKTANAPDLLTQSTTTFEEDAISRTLFNIPVFDERLGENYSVLIRQHALSIEDYNYLQIILKNTNQIGTFFDPQPSQLTGNLSAKGSNEPVIGFIGAYTTSEQRISIENEEVPDWGFALQCNVGSFLIHPDTVEKYFGGLGYTPLTYNEPRTMMFGVWPTCADCRRRGGNNNKPSFWDEIFP